MALVYQNGGGLDLMQRRVWTAAKGPRTCGDLVDKEPGELVPANLPGDAGPGTSRQQTGALG